MEKGYIEKLLSFLIGLSWGGAFLSFLVVFSSYLHSGFLTALVFALSAFLVASVFIVLFEYINYKVLMTKTIVDKLDRLIELSQKSSQSKSL